MRPHPQLRIPNQQRRPRHKKPLLLLKSLLLLLKNLLLLLKST
jgi:hypothetical protein